MVTKGKNQDYLKSKISEQNRNGTADDRDDAFAPTMTMDKGSVKTEYKRFLDEFTGYEESNGASNGTRYQHRDMIVTCICILKKYRKNISWDRITKNDLDRILEDLEKMETKHAGSYVRTFAVFISFLTDSEPIIDIGRYGILAGNRFMLLSLPDQNGERRKEGTLEERNDIECRFQKELDIFAEHGYAEQVSPITMYLYRRHVMSCIFVLEKRHAPLILSELVVEDFDYLGSYLKDFGVDRPDMKVRLFAHFVSIVTGTEPLVEQKKRIYNKINWSSQYKKEFRFTEELDRYSEMQVAKGNSRSTIDQTRSKVILCCGILDDLHKGFGLKDVDVPMMETVEAELRKKYPLEKAKLYVSRFSDFIQYITGKDLSAMMEKPVVYRIALDPQTEYDAKFVEQLREYIRYMEDWGYKDHTIRTRISAGTVCYKRLKEMKGDFELKDITAIDCRKLRYSFEGHTEGTIRNIMYNFGGFVEHMTGYDPCEDARLTYNSGSESRQFIFNDDWTKLYENADVMERLILSLGATMGLRRNEILSIRMEDILGTRLMIHGKGTGADGKVAVVEMSELVKKDLEDYIKVREQMLSVFGDRTNGTLLINMTKKNVGKAMNIRAFDNTLDRLQDRSGISFTSHCLRRFFCTTMSDAGIELDTIRRMMRHSSLDTTLKCYLYADPRKMHGAVSAVNDVFAAITS